MKKILISTILVLAMAASAYATSVKTAEHGSVPQRTHSPAQDICYIGYYNICSGWVFYWSGYCYGMFAEAPLPVQYGVCFDISACPETCRNLTDLYWACKRFTVYGVVDIEIFCGSPTCCPVGDPLAGIYQWPVPFAGAWKHFVFDNLALCPACNFSNKVVVRITDPGLGVHVSPYSDHVPLNHQAGCQDWRCTGHSYIFRNVVSYCDVYGMPAPMWVSYANTSCSDYPTVPPGCHNYTYNTGFYTEFLMDMYIACLGATATEKSSWSDIKKLYK
jgi:hypothetical protein